ncbi:carboxymuconolactone decarboxylase family protein [Streptomyces cupreus]|uniref:Carboxymuconolactone decarboxylase family protein n=1 Tax=Streptomyces cupreus TaxID=2759956 RepID=A0A7X1J4J5_9ACTN|nr:carboxymuconolactone decarboxylase family protein [Streptomyces cupreus]MBC2901602.1 carboxymuconolactone decarboxylase family protein [Streptomyces cupreus]
MADVPDPPHNRIPGGNHLPRVAPLPEDRWDARLRGLLATAPRDPGGGVPSIFTTLARHPDLYARFMPFAGQLLRGGLLPGRIRELLILRTAHNTGAAYEWGRHLPLAEAVGVTTAEVRRLTQDPDAAAGWTDVERHLLRAADQLHRDARISTVTWEALASHYEEAELIEITMLIGQYHMLAFFLNSTGVQLEPGFDRTGTGQGTRIDG